MIKEKEKGLEIRGKNEKLCNYFHDSCVLQFILCPPPSPMFSFLNVMLYPHVRLFTDIHDILLWQHDKCFSTSGSPVKSLEMSSQNGDTELGILVHPVIIGLKRWLSH